MKRILLPDTKEPLKDTECFFTTKEWGPEQFLVLDGSVYHTKHQATLTAAAEGRFRDIRYFQTQKRRKKK